MLCYNLVSHSDNAFLTSGLGLTFFAYMMHQQVLTFNNCTLCPHCIYMFCIYLSTNSDLCHLQHKLIGFYNRDEKCLQHGTDWVFK
jgi:ferredoxin